MTEQAKSPIHFIAGLPRSGSTLLAAILAQNPRFTTSMSSPLHGIFLSLMRAMSAGTDYAEFMSDDQRRAVFMGVFQGFTSTSRTPVTFDTNRGWASAVVTIAKLFPNARIICCLRSPAWILDSIERQVAASPWQMSRLFPQNVLDVYGRVDHLIKEHLVGPSLRTLRQAWFGEAGNRLIAVRYDSLTEFPQDTIAALYKELGEPSFEHEFDSVAFQAPEYDRHIGLPGFHTVRPRVESNRRATILPPDIFAQYDDCFWDNPELNPRRVVVI